VSQGFPAHLVDAGLQIVIERVDISASVPMSAAYFIRSFENLIADPRGAAMARKRAEKRSRLMPNGSDLDAIAHKLERDASAAGLSVRQLIISCGMGR